MSANFGFELDVRRLDPDSRAEIAAQIAFYKRHRRLLQFGRFTRLESPFEGNRAAWIFTDAARSEALVVAVRLEAGLGREAPVRLRGLDPEAVYEVVRVGRERSGPAAGGSPAHLTEADTPARLTGAELASAGIALDFPPGDYTAVMCYLERARDR
jgi:alpha-galactosidase